MPFTSRTLGPIVSWVSHQYKHEFKDKDTKKVKFANEDSGPGYTIVSRFRLEL